MKKINKIRICFLVLFLLFSSVDLVAAQQRVALNEPLFNFNHLDQELLAHSGYSVVVSHLSPSQNGEDIDLAVPLFVVPELSVSSPELINKVEKILQERVLLQRIPSQDSGCTVIIRREDGTPHSQDSIETQPVFGRSFRQENVVPIVATRLLQRDEDSKEFFCLDYLYRCLGFHCSHPSVCYIYLLATGMVLFFIYVKKA